MSEDKKPLAELADSVQRATLGYITRVDISVDAKYKAEVQLVINQIVSSINTVVADALPPITDLVVSYVESGSQFFHFLLKPADEAHPTLAISVVLMYTPLYNVFKGTYSTAVNVSDVHIKDPFPAVVGSTSVGGYWLAVLNTRSFTHMLTMDEIATTLNSIILESGDFIDRLYRDTSKV